MAEEDGEGRGGEQKGVGFAEVAGEPDGERALGDIEQQSEDAGEAAGGAQNVGGADVAAAHLSDVGAGAPAYDPGAEGEAAEGEGERNQPEGQAEQGTHRG